ncbi:MAG: phosphate/phosphite/phosphonate ABC transporter substrate-binding protein [Gemmataceae bacterium]
MSQTPDSAAVPPTPRKKGGSGAWLLLLILLFGIGTGAYAYFAIWIPANKPVNLPQILRLGLQTAEKLAEEFSDENGDLLADTPKEADKLLDPEVLRFATLDRDLEKANENWKEFFAHFQKVTGKKIELVETPSTASGMAEDLRDGKLHLASFSTGAVTLGVNQGGFIPVCVMADKEGKFEYQMEMLVHKSSAVKNLADLKGKTIQLTSISSLSSFRAPLVTLWREHKYLPGRDYNYTITRGQEDSILGVAEGKYEVVAVANDLLARVVARDKLSTDRFRSIYKSASYPPACFGHSHRLKPELATKVREAFLSFNWEGSGLEKAFGPANQYKFVAVDYKKDWEAVRAADQAMKELLNQNP